MLIHQAGKLKIGEVARYTVTYKPSADDVFPIPDVWHVKVRNTSAIPLRAAYLHGPYTLYAACYPKTFDPHEKDADLEQHGAPQFESQLKAGGSWDAQLTIPMGIRREADEAKATSTTSGKLSSVTWIIDIASQVLFSTSAAVQYEVLLGRDAKSLELGYAEKVGLPSSASLGQLQDPQQSRQRREGQSTQQHAGVFSKAVVLMVDDTISLWHKPSLPAWEDEGKNRGQMRDHIESANENTTSAGKIARDAVDTIEEDVQVPQPKKSRGKGSEKPKKRKKVHLVILTHGLHSNLGADMLYLKESIDAAAKKARLDVRARKAQARSQSPSIPHDSSTRTTATTEDRSGAPAPLSGGQDELPDRDNDDLDDEEVIVRGFPGNAVRTEKGIQYLGKRLAKWVLTMTYPDQPHLPIKKSMSRSISRAFSSHDLSHADQGAPSHHHSTIHREKTNTNGLAYQITSISFVGHSLGGLIQTYAIAYIHKHSPEFFTRIRPVNFIALATPFLGLSNENPVYVKFALDSGLVGRTGKDLGLTWRAPTMVRNGWGAMIAGIGTEGQRASRQQDPGQKPLLRVLPTGPARQVLGMFRNRTIYSNVVNDGIVPLRTSCMLFLDWSGLGKVEKARRENGLVGTMAGWGWAELAGINSGARSGKPLFGRLHSGHHSVDETSLSHSRKSSGSVVPQPDEGATTEDAELGREALAGGGLSSPEREQHLEHRSKDIHSPLALPPSPLAGLINLFKPASPRHDLHPPKSAKIYRQSQVLHDDDDTPSQGSSPLHSPDGHPSSARGDAVLDDPHNLFTPPRTTFFESAGDILSPPIPPQKFFNDPTSRPRTIFHDRVYHPEDIPPVPLRKRGSSLFGSASWEDKSRLKDDKEAADTSHHTNSSRSTPPTSGMRVEEKIARAYHQGLSWRKVLVRLEPDAHNNMIVRRMFSNAYGWPVVKHLVDSHFADTYPAVTKDADEPGIERAKPIGEAVGAHGEEVRNGVNDLDFAEKQEMRDEAHELVSPADFMRHDSATWDDDFFGGTDDEADDQDIYDSISIKRPWYGPHSRATSIGSRLAAGGGYPQELKDQSSGTEENLPETEKKSLETEEQSLETEEKSLETVQKLSESGKVGKEALVFHPHSLLVPLTATPSTTRLTGLGLQNTLKRDT